MRITWIASRKILSLKRSLTLTFDGAVIIRTIDEAGQPITAVPYPYWNNRSRGTMVLWSAKMIILFDKKAGRINCTEESSKRKEVKKKSLGRLTLQGSLLWYYLLLG